MKMALEPPPQPTISQHLADYIVQQSMAQGLDFEQTVALAYRMVGAIPPKEEPTDD